MAGGTGKEIVEGFQTKRRSVTKSMEKKTLGGGKRPGGPQKGDDRDWYSEGLILKRQESKPAVTVRSRGGFGERRSITMEYMEVKGRGPDRGKRE